MQTIYILIVLISSISLATACIKAHLNPVPGFVCTDVVFGNETQQVCICPPRYLGANCDCVQADQTATFLMSFCLGPLAVDRFYLGYTGVGVVKLLFSMIISIIIAVIKCCVKGDGRPTFATQVAVIVICILSFGPTVWWLTDWILILRGELPDADGDPLYNAMYLP